MWFYLRHGRFKGKSGWLSQVAGLSESFAGSDFCLLRVAQVRAAKTGAREGVDIVWEARSLPLGSLLIKESMVF